jgi:hypothetical protein
VFFTSKDENLTKSHIRYLEGRLIELARNAQRAEVKNSQGSKSRLPESDTKDMEYFIEKMLQLLPVLGVEVFVPITTSTGTTNKQNVLICKIKNITAEGYLTPNGMVVKKGSQAVLTERKCTENYPLSLIMRNQMREEDVLIEKSNHLFFKRDYEFTSPSAAARVIHGGPANGLTAWKTKEGKTLKEIESE